MVWYKRREGGRHATKQVEGRQNLPAMKAVKAWWGGYRQGGRQACRKGEGWWWQVVGKGHARQWGKGKSFSSSEGTGRNRNGQGRWGKAVHKGRVNQLVGRRPKACMLAKHCHAMPCPNSKKSG